MAMTLTAISSLWMMLQAQRANIIAVDSTTHGKISGYYSSKQSFTDGKTIRDWLAGQDFQTQFDFGMDVLRKFGVIE